MLTWDPRGFGQSGGQVEVDSPDYEARDASALIDWLAQQPEAQLDKAGDPRVGMNGSSYGGGIQWITAARDARVDVITPNISWNSLTTSLYKEGSLKAGWGLVLCGAGIGASLPGGLMNPDGIELSRLDPHVFNTCVNGIANGYISPADQAWFAAHGPNTLLSKVKIPTLITQGTADTLFTLKEAIRNYASLRSRGIPTKMLWFCGGHGVCLTGAGEAGHIERTRAQLVRALPEAGHHGPDRPALRVAGGRRPVALGARTTRSAQRGSLTASPARRRWRSRP